MVWVCFVGMPYLLRSYRADVMSRHITRHYAGAACRADLLLSYRRLVGGFVPVGLLGDVVEM